MSAKYGFTLKLAKNGTRRKRLAAERERRDAPNPAHVPPWKTTFLGMTWRDMPGGTPHEKRINFFFFRRKTVPPWWNSWPAELKDKFRALGFHFERPDYAKLAAEKTSS